MSHPTGFTSTSPTTLADIVGAEQVMDIGIRPLWSSMPRVAGPAFTVRCPPGDNLMLHAAIHRAEPGSVIVVESGDVDHALAGGNVCAVAQRRGVGASQDSCSTGRSAMWPKRVRWAFRSSPGE